MNVETWFGVNIYSWLSLRGPKSRGDYLDRYNLKKHSDVLEKNQQYALICTTPLSHIWLLHVSAVVFRHEGASYTLLSYLKYTSNGWYIIQCVVTWPVCRSVVVPSWVDTQSGTTIIRHTGYVTTHDIPPIRSVFQVTQKDLRSSLMTEIYCRNK
jgi:hypothetical protein